MLEQIDDNRRDVIFEYLRMSRRNQTAMEKMQDIANRLISNTPELVKILDNESALKPRRPLSPGQKKGAPLKGGTQYPQRNQMTANDYHDKFRDLSKQLQVSHEKVFALEEEISIIKQRFVQREIQYRKIIEQLQDELQSKSSLGQSDHNRMNQISDLHREILDNIGTIQHKTSKILVEQETDIRRFFHKKMNEMKEKFKQQKINKTEKDQEFIEKEKQMVGELEWIKNIAQKIDIENQSLMKKYTTLKSEYEIQEKDKDLLMKELLMKKKENAVLKSQVQQYEKLLNEVSKQMEDSEFLPNQSSEMILDDLEKAEKMPKGLKLDRNNPVSKKTKTNVSESKVSVSNRNYNEKYENTISHLNNVITKERKKVREIKNLYMREINSKSELEKIIRKLVDDVRVSIVQVERERAKRRKDDNELSLQARERLLEQLLSNQKVLTLIYDKTFYQGPRSSQFDRIPEQLSKILQNNDEEGFY